MLQAGGFIVCFDPELRDYNARHAPNSYRSTAERRHADVLSTAHKQVALPHDAERLSFELRFRCAIADYILNSKQKTLEDRVYDLVAGMSLDVGTVIPPENGAKNQSP